MVAEMHESHSRFDQGSVLSKGRFRWAGLLFKHVLTGNGRSLGCAGCVRENEHPCESLRIEMNRNNWGESAVPYSVPRLDQTSSQSVVIGQGGKSPTLAREMGVIAVHLKPSLLPDGELIIRWSQVQILAGPPTFSISRCFNQLDRPLCALSSNSRTFENKTSETRSTARRCESGMTWEYVLSVVPRSE